jgi:sigma-B regulation protein RsbU (phosphoserine phosphatase)
MRRSQELAIAFAVAVVAFFATNGLEAGLLRLSGGNVWELAWSSEVALSLLVMTATYLWLHVRSLRGALTEAERAQVAVDSELRLAARVQRKLLDNVKASPEAVLWCAAIHPAGQVGGDFYDVVDLDPERALLLIADVAGKGVPAALGLASARSAFRMIVQTVDDPAEIAEQWSRWMRSEFRGSSYVTAILLRADRAGRRIRYVNAGHPAGVLLGPSGEQRLGSTCAPLGLLEGATIQAADVEWRKDMLGVLFTDGVSEALEDGDDPIESLIGLARPLLFLPPHQVCSRLMASLGAAKHRSVAPPDDKTILAFRAKERG